MHPEVLEALSPTYAFDFLFTGGGFFALASVVLAITGVEALYADLGHFGRAPITRAWLLLVFPACILNYFGQGALILDDRHDRCPFASSCRRGLVPCRTGDRRYRYRLQAVIRAPSRSPTGGQAGTSAPA
jgi:hypothetical protein